MNDSCANALEAFRTHGRPVEADRRIGERSPPVLPCGRPAARALAAHHLGTVATMSATSVPAS
jgi:hypothetical protein